MCDTGNTIMITYEIVPVQTIARKPGTKLKLLFDTIQIWREVKDQAMTSSVSFRNTTTSGNA